MKKLFTVIFLSGLFLSFKANSTPILNSLPTAQATIFLDFDGQYVYGSSWNGGRPLDCASSGLTDVQITEVFNRVSEDYRPFDINITTDSVMFLAAPLTKRIRIIITSTSSWYPNVGGVAYTGSFTWGDDTPGFVFSDKLGPFRPKMVAECCSHESGHTLSLSHQAKYSGTCTLLATYHDGIGTGETAWAPVMGNSYYRNFSGWNNGPTPTGCTADQDNLSIITSYNGFTYRQDDHSDDTNLNPTTLLVTGTSFSNSGIITTSNDKDVFKLTFSKYGALHLEVLPFSVGTNNDGADLDVKITLLNSSSQVIRVYDDPAILNIAVDTTLNAGKYFLVVEGAGNVNISDYGSLGSYKISGTNTPLIITPVRQVLLTGKVDNSNHSLSWNIIADEPINYLLLESSHNGTIFTTLTTFSSSSREFNYNPGLKENIFYRLKVNSITGQSVYSNIISLNSNGNAGKRFTVSTLVHDYVTINATRKFDYTIVDVSGRIIMGGNGRTGLNTININDHPNGIYYIQITSENQRTTERIVRL
ncbi:MAG: T9SS type A sorting domain-containing protein [Chitinophagaceae bacterium]